MRENPMDTQALRSERLTVAVTEAERKAVEAVAHVRGVNVSTLLREHVEEIVAEHRRMLDALSRAA